MLTERRARRRYTLASGPGFRPRWLGTIGVLTLLLLAGLPAGAQPQPQPRPLPAATAGADAAPVPTAKEGTAPAATGQPAAAPEGRKPAPQLGGGKMIVLEEEVIEGRIQKPEAFYILQRSNLNYKSLELQKSFLPGIIEPVRKAPF